MDGVATQQLPTDRPAVVQSLGSDGKVLRTAYAWPESAWPPVVQPSAVQAPVVQAPAVQPPDPPHRPRIAPLVTGALSLAIAGTGGALAASAYDRSKHENFLLQCPNYWRDGSCPQMGNPQFQGWYKNSFVPAWLGGLTMVGVGVAGLAGSSIWLVAGPSSVQVGGDF